MMGKGGLVLLFNTLQCTSTEKESLVFMVEPEVNGTRRGC